MVMPREVYERISINISILNINDNAPIFSSSEVRISIPESDLIGQRVEVPELVAHDADFNSKLTYVILDNLKFKIEASKNRVFLIVDDILDHETSQYEYLTIEVTDEDEKSARTELIVEVLDQNDAAPKFKNSFEQIDIGELTEPDSFIHQVEAEDSDSGRNGQIRYEIVSVEPKQAIRLIQIDATTGKLTNFEQIQRHDFET